MLSVLGSRFLALGSKHDSADDIRPTTYDAVSALFRQIRNLVLEDEEIRLAVSGEPQHVAIVIFDPAAHSFARDQLQSNWGLFVRQMF